MHWTHTLSKFGLAHVGGGPTRSKTPVLTRSSVDQGESEFQPWHAPNLNLPLGELGFKVGRNVRFSTLILQDDGYGDGTVSRIPCAARIPFWQGDIILDDRWWCRESTAPWTQGKKAAMGGERCTNWCPPRSSTTPKQTVGASPALCSPGTTDWWQLRATATFMRGATSPTSWWSSTPPPKSGAKCSLRSTALSKLYEHFSYLPFPSFPMLTLLSQKRRRYSTKSSQLVCITIRSYAVQ